MGERATRMGKNEALFRQVNERLREIGESFSLVTERSDFVCECTHATCAEPIQMSLEDYERLRAQPEWFALRPGHEIVALERVVEQHDGYNIVEKHEGGPAELARDADPRS